MECADRDVLGGASICRNESVDPARCAGNVTLHPCCIGLLGDCVITSEENCSFNEGTYHPDLVLSCVNILHNVYLEKWVSKIYLEF